MKMVSARTIVTCPGRNFVTLKLETDEGVYGIGDATFNGRELAADVYNGRRNDILDRRSMNKSRTLTQRKIQNLRIAG